MGNLHENKHVPNETRMNAELQSLIERYRSMASREGAPAHAFARLSDAYRHAGDTRLAIETAAEGLRRHAGSLLVQEALGIALLDADEDEAAVRALAPVVEKLPDNSRAACSLAVALSRLSREEQAIAALDRRLARDRFDGDALSLRAAIREGRPLDYTPAAAPIPAAPAEPPPPEPEPEIEEEAVEEKPKWSAVPMPVKRKEERGPSREEREKRKEERGEVPVVPVRRPGVAPKPAPPPAIAYPPPMVVEQEERGPSREERGKRKEERGESQRPVTAIGAAHDRVPPATVAQVSASVSQGSAQGGALDDFVVRSVEGLFAGRDAAPIVLDDILSPRHFEPPPAKPPARASIDDLDSMIDELDRAIEEDFARAEAQLVRGDAAPPHVSGASPVNGGTPAGAREPGAADVAATAAEMSAAPPAVAEITVEEEWITDYGDTPGDESPVEADDADRHVAYLPPHPEFLEDAPKPGFFRRAMRKLFGRKGVVKNSAKAEDVKDTVKEPSGDSGADPAHANAENDFESKFFDRVDSPIDDRPGADAAKPETPATERGFSDRRAGDRTPAVSAAEAKAAPEEDAGGDRRESDDRRDAARDAKGGRRQADEKRKKGKTKKRRR